MTKEQFKANPAAITLHLSPVLWDRVNQRAIGGRSRFRSSNYQDFGANSGSGHSNGNDWISE